MCALMYYWVADSSSRLKTMKILLAFSILYCCASNSVVGGLNETYLDQNDLQLQAALLSMMELKNCTPPPKNGVAIPLEKGHILNLFRLTAGRSYRGLSSPELRARVSTWDPEEKRRARVEHCRVIDFINRHQKGLGHLAEAVQKRAAYQLGLLHHHQQWIEIYNPGLLNVTHHSPSLNRSP